ncbi:hypothetical protein DVH24_042028 [Malus domestica]|uniref:Uncharacterized protein n=1 Tax=Malus domestica TaxID=3750 RepID=A0A498IPS0_MALDO|nr:hypothetical protein DVH24_042028 [Malus domestica]
MEERHKIQVFQRELPFCLELVTQLPKPKVLRRTQTLFKFQLNFCVLSRKLRFFCLNCSGFCFQNWAIERCKQQISNATADYLHGQSKCSEQTSSEGRVFEEFIPLTRISYNSRCTTQGGIKKDSTFINFSKFCDCPFVWLLIKFEVKKWKVLIFRCREEQVKGYSDGDEEKWGAFQPFQMKKKSIGKTNGPVAKEPSSAPATSSTTDTVSGDSGGNNKKEEKDEQGNEGETGHRSCTAGSCMLFSSTTWWFTWYAVEINLVGYFGTWAGTERCGTRRFVPRLVCLKRVERAVPRDEFWMNFYSASPPRTTHSTFVEHKIITSPSPSSSSLFPSESIFAHSPLCPVLSRPVSFRSVPSRLHTKRYLKSPRQEAIPIYLGSRGFRYISNFYLDWVSVDFRVRMSKYHFDLVFDMVVWINYLAVPSLLKTIVDSWLQIEKIKGRKEKDH